MSLDKLIFTWWVQVLDSSKSGLNLAPLNRKLLKPYVNSMAGSNMVVIQCPHCGEDVELEDDASGLFDCPLCGNNFDWNEDFHSNDLKSKFLLFLFSIFSPSILFVSSLWLMVSVFSPFSFEILLYLVISLGLCVLYTISLAIYGGLKKNKPLLQGALLSIVATYLTIFMMGELL